MSSDPAENERLSMAIAIAAKAHKRDKYNDRDPYVFHPIRVMFRVPGEARIVAVLHDVLEDTDETAPDWLTDDEREALDLLTHRKEDTYKEYIVRIATAKGRAGHLAREVKVADSRDHLAHNPPPRLRARYGWVLGRLISERRPMADSPEELAWSLRWVTDDRPEALPDDAAAEALRRAVPEEVANPSHGETGELSPGNIVGRWRLEKDDFLVARTEVGAVEVLFPDGEPAPLAVGKLLLRGRKVG